MSFLDGNSQETSGDDGAPRAAPLHRIVREAQRPGPHGQGELALTAWCWCRQEKRKKYESMASSRMLLRAQGRRRLLEEFLAPVRPQLEFLRHALAARGDLQSRCIQSSGLVHSQQGQVDALRALIPDVAKQSSREVGQEARERQNAAVVGTAWEARSLRKKSFDDLHALWLTLYKERNALHAEKLAWKRAGQRMPQATRLSKTRLSMNRIKQVMSERLNDAGYSEDERSHLKAFIDAM
jgi:hypothetical protein